MKVAVVQQPGGAPDELLEAALTASGFWSLLQRRRASRRRAKRDLSIAIKPDLDMFAADAATGTSPALVETMVARLRHEGYPNVAICDGRNRRDDWLHNRDAMCVPDLVGYRFEAPPGEPYTVSWVEDDPEVVPLAARDDSGALLVHGAWARADVRISFAKAKTDDGWGYALTVANLLGLVSPSSRAARWSAEDRALHVMRRVPPHMAVIDATVGSHGRAGSRISNPIATDTIIASPSALLADWVGALKMGADPHASPVNALSLERLGLPDPWVLDGDASAWDGWHNPSPILVQAVRGRARWPELDAFARAVLQPTDREHFAFRDVVVDQISAAVLQQLDRVTDSRVRDWIETLLASALNVVAASRFAVASSATKGDVIQSEAPITLDVDALADDEFSHTTRVVGAQERVLDGAAEDAHGYRFRTVNGHIHFAASRLLPIAFDEFVDRVDVSASIRHMNDYVGGSWIVVQTDKRGRALRQVERNVYLPQPNWTGLFGGDVIDVEKIEQMAYARDRHEIRWRTVLSPNGSAESDDGAVVFERTPAGQVQVRVFARQRFRLPATLAAVHIEQWPRVHRELAGDAYARFFDGTIANFRASFDGRPYRIGKRARTTDVIAEGSDLRALFSGAMAIVSRALGWVPSASAGSSRSSAVQPLFLDEWGFAHFAGSNVPAVVAASGRVTAPVDSQLTPLTFLTELGRAVGKDLAGSGTAFFPDGGALRGATS